MTRDPADAYCPTCRARPGDECRTSSGRVAHKPHKTRVTGGLRAIRGSSTAPTAVRLAVSGRSGGRCEYVEAGDRCRAHASEQHHRRRRSQGGADTAENLLDLCSEHHRWVHAHPEAAYAAGLLLRGGA